MSQIDLLRFVFGILERLGVEYALVGSFATGVWGNPRMTRDIDIVIRLEPAQIDSLCEAFNPDEFYLSSAAAADAVRNAGQFNVIHFVSGNKVDFMVSGPSDWAQAQLARRRRVNFLPQCEGFVAAPEDVIIGKLIYYREGGSEKHLLDIASILDHSREEIDRRYLEQQVDTLALQDEWAEVRPPDWD